MSNAAIRVRDLVKLYNRRGQPTVRAIDLLTFDIARGSIFGLLGPNGAGKTTLLRVLSTLSRPTSGVASVLGHDVVTAPLEVRRRISVVMRFATIGLGDPRWITLEAVGFIAFTFVSFAGAILMLRRQA